MARTFLGTVWEVNHIMYAMSGTVKHISSIQASLVAAGQQSAYWG